MIFQSPFQLVAFSTQPVTRSVPKSTIDWKSVWYESNDILEIMARVWWPCVCVRPLSLSLHKISGEKTPKSVLSAVTFSSLTIKIDGGKEGRTKERLDSLTPKHQHVLHVNEALWVIDKLTETGGKMMKWTLRRRYHHMMRGICLNLNNGVRNLWFFAAPPSTEIECG